MDPTSQHALVIIAVAISVQTLMMIGAIVALAIEWQRMRTVVESRVDALESRLDSFTSGVDELAVQARAALQTVEDWSDRARGVVSEAGGVILSVASAVAAPRALLLAGAASAASQILSRWRGSRRHRPASA